MVEPYWIRVRDHVTKQEWLINPTRLAEILKEHTDLKQLLGVCDLEQKYEWHENRVDKDADSLAIMAFFELLMHKPESIDT